MNFKEKIKSIVSKETFDKLSKYINLIEENNKRMNLTGFKDDVLWKEGIYQSFCILENIIGKVNNKKILDIGSGVGFPSIPYLICNPNNEVIIYEPILKRANFLEIVKKELNLNVSIKKIRAEDSRKIEEFDVITARAVAHFAILAEISHKLAKINCIFVFLKGPKSNLELEESKWIIQKLKIDPKIKIIKIDEKINNIIFYHKKQKTPIYFPREWKKIKISLKNN